MKYVKKAIPIEAWKIEEWWFDKNNKEKINIQHFDKNVKLNYENKTITIYTIEGDMLANLEDYLICGVFGEFYSCKKDIFESTYDVYLDG